MMSGRERVMTVLNHKIPDRVPVYEVLIDPPVVEAMIGVSGKNTAMLEPRQLVDLYCRIGLDCVIASLKFFRPTAFVDGGNTKAYRSGAGPVAGTVRARGRAGTRGRACRGCL